jgi:hypothetical protein
MAYLNHLARPIDARISVALQRAAQCTLYLKISMVIANHGVAPSGGSCQPSFQTVVLV